MKFTLVRLSIKTLLFLLISLSSFSLSAQQKPDSIEGYWKGQGYQLYLHQGLFLLQSEANAALSGVYHLEDGYLLLGQPEVQQAYKIAKRGNTLWLQGAETEIRLQADTHAVVRNIFMGTISQIGRENQQNEASSQLPEQYFN